MAVADVVAQNYIVWLQESVAVWCGGIVEVETIWPIVHADVVDKGLVFIAEGGEVRGMASNGGGTCTELTE